MNHIQSGYIWTLQSMIIHVKNVIGTGLWTHDLLNEQLEKSEAPAGTSVLKAFLWGWWFLMYIVAFLVTFSLSRNASFRSFFNQCCNNKTSNNCLPNNNQIVAEASQGVGSFGKSEAKTDWQKVNEKKEISKRHLISSRLLSFSLIRNFSMLPIIQPRPKLRRNRDRSDSTKNRKATKSWIR